MGKVWAALKGWKMIIGNVVLLGVVPLIPNPGLAEIVKQVAYVIIGIGGADRMISNFKAKAQ